MTARRRNSTRERILKATWRRLLRGDRAHLGQVAADAGVSRQAIHLHFGSRGGLLLALAAHVDETFGLGERLAEARATAFPDDRLEAVLRLMACYNGEIHATAMAVARQAHDDPDLRAAFEDRMARRRADLRQLLEPLRREGRLHGAWSLEEAVDVLWDLTAPSSYQHLVVERGWTPERFADWVVWSARALLA